MSCDSDCGLFASHGCATGNEKVFVLDGFVLDGFVLDRFVLENLGDLKLTTFPIKKA
jgi:hypothetical protein